MRRRRIRFRPMLSFTSLWTRLLQGRFQGACLLLFVGPFAGGPAGGGQPGADASGGDLDMMSPTSVYVAAKEVAHLIPGETVDLDADDLVFPGPLSKAPAGKYRAQVVLDIHHSYNYDGRSAGDVLSAPTPVSLPLSLGAGCAGSSGSLAKRADVAAALRPVDFVSHVLTSYWGRAIHMRGWVLLPPDYSEHAKERYPTAYFTHGFGGLILDREISRSAR
jgi:hypothetical protein